MKKIVTIVLALFAFTHLSIAIPTDDRDISKGSVLNYTVNEGSVSYKLKVTVTEWTYLGDIKLQWQTTGAKSIKGTCNFTYESVEGATEMKIKLKQGNENLAGSESRWFGGYEAFDYMYIEEIDADLIIDGEKSVLTPNEDEVEKEILYNNVKTGMDYAEGYNEDDDVRIGLIQYAPGIVILSNYTKGDYSMILTSIQSAVPKKSPTPVKPPKGKTVYKKMEPGKFAKVKSKYPLLATIESFDVTKGGQSEKPFSETYDFRYATGAANPPSLIDCFTADIKIIYNQRDKMGIADITETIGGKNLSSASAIKIMGVYLSKEARSIPGYMPWTHWSFVKSLTESQRNQLAKELAGYIKEYGFSE
jgi:hypothetical protein